MELIVSLCWYVLYQLLSQGALLIVNCFVPKRYGHTGPWCIFLYLFPSLQERTSVLLAERVSLALQEAIALVVRAHRCLVLSGVSVL